MINWNHVSGISAARRARVASVGDALHGFAAHLAGDGEDGVNEPHWSGIHQPPVARPRPTLGPIPPVGSSRPLVAAMAPPRAAYATFRGGALGHTVPAVQASPINGMTV